MAKNKLPKEYRRSGAALLKARADDKLKRRCSACSGSGHYDVTGSPACASCGGLGEDPPASSGAI